MRRRQAAEDGLSNDSAEIYEVRRRGGEDVGAIVDNQLWLDPADIGAWFSLASTGPLTRWLRSADHPPSHAGIDA